MSRSIIALEDMISNIHHRLLRVRTYIDVFFEAEAGVGTQRWEDSALCTILWDIFILERLCAGQSIVLIEQSTLVDRIVPAMSISRHTSTPTFRDEKPTLVPSNERSECHRVQHHGSAHGIL